MKSQPGPDSAKSAELFSVGDDEAPATSEQNDEVPVSDHSRPTDWLANLNSDPAAATKLEQYMRTRARALASKWIGSRTQAGVGASDVAASAVASLFMDLMTQQFQPADSKSLFRALLVRIRNKAIDVLRKRHNSKRDVGREESASLLLPDTGDSPDDLAIVNELTERVVELIEQEPDELRRQVTYLGLIEGLTAAEIVAAVKAKVASGKGRVPSVSSVHVRLRAAKSQIQETLRREGFLDDE